jgi:hypothetical protein
LLTDTELHRLTGRRLQERTSDRLARQPNVDELRAPAAEIGTRVEQRKSTMPTGCARASGGMMPAA